MAVIDVHAHIYPNKIASKAVDAVGDFYNIEMYGEGTAEHLLAAQDRAPITNFVVHSVATSPRAVETINDFIAEQCRIHPEFIGFMTMHQDYPDPEKEIERAIGLGLKGMKLHPDSQHVDMDDPRLMEVYEIIAGVCLSSSTRAITATTTRIRAASWKSCAPSPTSWWMLRTSAAGRATTWATTCCATPSSATTMYTATRRAPSCTWGSVTRASLRACGEPIA